MRILGPLVLVTACGGSTSDKPVVLLDAMRADSTNAPDASHATSVLINSFGPSPLLLAMRDGAGPWAALDVTATSFSVTQSSFQLLAVCAEGTTFTTGIAAQTASDGAVSMPCFAQSGPGTPPTTVAITGQMAQPGSVWMYNTATGAASPWTYALDVTPGPHDFIAADAAKIAITRNLTISTAGAGPTVDVEQTGTAFDLAAFSLANLAAAAVVANDVEWLTGREFINLPGTGTTVPTIPAALFGTNDFEVVGLLATDGLKLQTVQEFIQGSPVETTVALLPELTGVVFTGASATWGTLPAGFDSATLEVDGANGNIESITATPAWLADASALAIELTDVPGYLPAWRVRNTNSTHQFSIAKSVSQMTNVSTGVRDSAAFTGKHTRLRAERARASRR